MAALDTSEGAFPPSAGGRSEQIRSYVLNAHTQGRIDKHQRDVISAAAGGAAQGAVMGLEAGGGVGAVAGAIAGGAVAGYFTDKLGVAGGGAMAGGITGGVTAGSVRGAVAGAVSGFAGTLAGGTVSVGSVAGALGTFLTTAPSLNTAAAMWKALWSGGKVGAAGAIASLAAGYAVDGLNSAFGDCGCGK